ncbi:MAG: DMT family transporter [Pseudochelatococcus sp.]|jgi:drug/metabolite transporter (DMT)-like permease|uniref:DMT family transporter n=1 Tax=Pseudochelatococcus sp. TaxID=2020869 RepID=UPI003D918DF9
MSTTNAPAGNSLAGILIMAVAAALVATTTFLAKALAHGIGAGTEGAALPAFEISAGRFVFAFMFLLPFAARLRTGIALSALPLHGLRTLFGWGGTTALFTAAALISLADATAISFLNPVIAMLLAVPFLGERVGPWRWGAAAMAVAGAVILIRPDFGHVEPAMLIALLSALFLGSEMICVKLLLRAETRLKILLINNAIGTVLSVAVASSVAVWPTLPQVGMMVALGGFMLLAQTCTMEAMRLADASLVMPVLYSTLVFAAVFDYLAFGTIPSPPSIVGSLMIVSGALLLAWREVRSGRRRGARAQADPSH